MNKKVTISLFLVITIMVVTTVMAGAQPSPPVQLPPEVAGRINALARLENKETGEVVYFNPHLIDFKSPQSANDAGMISYEVGIPSRNLASTYGTASVPNQPLFPSVVFADESKYKCDSTSSACATLTFYYVDGTTEEDWMYAQYYSSTWTKPDPTVSWSNAYLGGRCFGEWFYGSGYCSDTYLSYVGTPNPGSTYNRTPPWSGSDKKTLVNELHWQDALQQIDLHRGNNHWTFSFCVANGGGSAGTGCY